MKIYIACDHRGVELKKYLIDNLKKSYEVYDSLLPNSSEDDYPDFAFDICTKMDKEDDLGILICGTGIGISIAANKVKGIRCALCTSTELAKMTRLHNNANMLALGASAVSEELAMQIVDTFLDTEFSNEERHIRRVDLIEK